MPRAEKAALIRKARAEVKLHERRAEVVGWGRQFDWRSYNLALVALDKAQELTAEAKVPAGQAALVF